MRNPIDDFFVSKDELQFVGHDLYRPECILALRDGTLCVADSRGGVQFIHPDGTQRLVTDKPDAGRDQDLLAGHDLPNGICFAKDGRVLIANQGRQCVEIMSPDGRRTTVLDEIDGKPLGVVNFVLRDVDDRLWITVATRHATVVDVMKPGVGDGYVALLEGDSARIVAEGFHLTNEIRLDRERSHAFVVETFGKKITRLKVRPDGELTHPETFGPSDMGPAGFPDGIAFDSFGNLWGTITGGERIFAITPDGDFRILFDDRDRVACENIERAFQAGALTTEILFSGHSSVAPSTSSVTFGGPDLRTVYVGSLFGRSIPYFAAPVAGEPMPWW